jgi:hypothetical protein
LIDTSKWLGHGNWLPGRQVRNLLVGSSVGKLRVTEKIESRHYLFLKVELLLTIWIENQLCVLGMYILASSMHPKRRSENVRRQVIHSSRGKMRKMRTPIFNAQLPKKKQKQMFTKREYPIPQLCT